MSATTQPESWAAAPYWLRTFALGRAGILSVVRQPFLLEFAVACALVLQVRSRMLSDLKTLNDELGVVLFVGGTSLAAIGETRERLFGQPRTSLRNPLGIVLGMLGVLLLTPQTRDIVVTLNIYFESPLGRVFAGFFVAALWALVKAFWVPGRVIVYTVQLVVGTFLLRDAPISISQVEVALDGDPATGINQLVSLNILAGTTIIAKTFDDIIKHLREVSRELYAEAQLWLNELLSENA